MEYLGSPGAPVLALAPPFGWGLRELACSRMLSPFTGLALVSLQLAGDIGLSDLDAQWPAGPEAAIPVDSLHGK